MNATPPDFEEIEHTADWALRVRGADLRELLSHAARGMSSLLVPDLAVLPIDVVRQVELDALDAESLLVEWLGELAYWAESELLVFREYDLAEVSPTHLRARLRGGRVPGLQKHIKAVTYHNLKIVATEGGLETTIVFDV
jgi:SHS2 domain-containing protein